MVSRLAIVSLSLCLCAIAVVNSASIRTLDAYKKDLETNFASDSLQHFTDFYHKVQNLVENGKESAERLVSKDLACKYLKRISYQRALNAGLGSQFVYLYNAFGCPADDLKAEYATILKSAQRGDRIDDILSAIHLAHHHKEYHGAEIKEACAKAFDLLKDDGTARAYKRSGEYNISNTAKVLDVLNRCQNVGALAANVTKNKLKGAFTSIIDHGRALGQGIKAFAEGNFFDTTSKLTHLIHKLDPQAIKSQDLSQFIGYLKGQGEALDSAERHHLFHRAAGTFKDVPVVELQTKSVNKGKDAVLRAKITNLLGQDIAEGNFKLKGSLYGIDEKDQTIAVASGINFEKKSGNEYEAKLKAADLTKTDHYQLRLTVSSGSSSYEYVEDIVVKGEITVSSVQFGVTKTSDRINAPLDHQVKVGETIRNTLQANQGNYIQVEIKVASGSPRIGFIGARLVRQDSKPTTGTVAAKLDRDSNEYRTIIDLGDPEHILPYNGQYALEVIISGEYSETIRWTLANLDITFIKPSDKAPASDADVQLLPEIRHQFPGERRKPTFVITVVFAAAAIVALVGFLGILTKIGVNFSNLPSSASGRLYSLIFLGLIAALLGTLVLFWFKINIFETLLILSILTIPTIIFGDKALRYISLQDQKSE